MDMLRIFIGHDERQAVSTNVCMNSIYRHSSKPVQITPLVLSQLPIDRQGLTPFTFSRFLVPYLCDYKGWALFMDCDFLIRSDIADLFALADDRYSVMVVKNKLNYEWASLMLFNCAKCQILTPEYVSKADNLHSIVWADKKDIGALPAEWNHLVGYDKPNPTAKIVHYTQGMPSDPVLANCEYGPEWKEEFNNMAQTQSWEALMGTSIHTAIKDGKLVPRLEMEAPGEAAELLLTKQQVMHSSHAKEQQDQFSKAVASVQLPEAMKSYSRNASSEHYQQSLSAAKQAYEQGLVESKLADWVVLASALKPLFEQAAVKSFLEHGCGDGQHHQPVQINSSQGQFQGFTDFLNAEAVLHDPNHSQYAELDLSKKQPVVISVHELEKYNELDLGWIAQELFELAEKAVVVVINTEVKAKVLADGSSMPMLAKPAYWWVKLLAEARGRSQSKAKCILFVTNGDMKTAKRIEF